MLPHRNLDLGFLFFRRSVFRWLTRGEHEARGDDRRAEVLHLMTAGRQRPPELIDRIAANSSANARTGTLTIGGLTFTVSQSGVAAAYSLSPAKPDARSG